MNAQPERFDYCSGIGSGGCTDLDVLIERHAKFLAIENKRPGESISAGQMKTLRQLSRQEKWTVWLVFGQPPDEIYSMRVVHPEIGVGEHVELDVTGLRSRIQDWWDAA